MTTQDFKPLSNFIWSVADLLRGPYRPPQYERVMLPMTVLRRFDCVLQHSKHLVLKKHDALVAKAEADIKAGKEAVTDFDNILNRIAKDADGNELGFHNHSQLDFQKLKGDPDNVGRHLQDYINGFSQNVRDIFDRFEFDKEIEKMEDSNRLYLVVAKFADIDLHPAKVDNMQMGYVFEDLIRRFNESANETAGDHFTPREVIQLMVNLLMEPDMERIAESKSPIITICDPTCGTGGMLAEAQSWILEHNAKAKVKVYGQDYNPRSFAVAASDLLIKGHKDSSVTLGNTLTNPPFEKVDGFDYLLANPPFGVDWKAEKKEIARWKDFHGYDGKLPRVNDGAFLFLLYMLSKRIDYKPSKGQYGTRIAIVFNGSPLFTGGAGSGESDIRRWIIENDWLESIVALPESMFYNTAIGTFIWVVTNQKEEKRKGKVQLIDCRDRWVPMDKSLGNKRRLISEDEIEKITNEHGEFEEDEHNKIFDNNYFGFRRVTVERPLRLRFQITDDAKADFLNQLPEYYDAVLMLEEILGQDVYHDWNEILPQVNDTFKISPCGWAAGVAGGKHKKYFRDVFCVTESTAEPVIAKTTKLVGVTGKGFHPGQQLVGELTPSERDQLYGFYPAAKQPKKMLIYESDPKLRDNENIPLQQDVEEFFLREVRPFVADAWINPDSKLRDEQDKGIGKVGYEINFNREFFSYKEPKTLEQIDKELEIVEKKIISMLMPNTQV